MCTRLRQLPAVAFVCSLIAVSAYAQDATVPVSSPPANLAHVEGDVDVVHEGVTGPADSTSLLVDGDLVRTRNGRAEVVFADGTLLHLDRDAELELLGPERIRLLAGRIIFRMSSSAARPYVVDTPAAVVRFDASGEYMVAADEGRPQLAVSVARGAAEVDDATERVAVRAGERLLLAATGTRPLLEPFNSARLDAFSQWSSDRVHGFTAARSSSQLPYELRPYSAVFDQYGRWDYVAAHGYVWFPSVAVGWRPYYDGSWAHTRYGWTWHGRDRWAWPTHHYGRWGFNGNFWFWIPAKVWGPAWVSWGFAPGYVSWSPLGWDGRPAIGFWGRRDHPAYWPNHNPWRAWTIVPRHSFGPRRAVRVHAIDGSRLAEGTRRAIVVQNTPPASPVGGAVPRGSLSVAGTAGNVRREAGDGPRPGTVRRPDATRQPGPASTSRSWTASPSRRTADAPEYAPPSPSAQGARRRAPSRPPQADNAERSGARSREPAMTAPRASAPRVSTPAAPPPTVATTPRAGAVRSRDGGVGTSRRAAPADAPRDQSPRDQSPRTSGGVSERESGGGRGAPAREASPPPRAVERSGRVRDPGAASQPRPEPSRANRPAEPAGSRPRSGSAPSARTPNAPSSGGAVRRRPPG